MCEFINSFDSAKVSFDSSATSGGWYHSTKIVSTNCQSSINYLCINVNFLLFIEKLMKLVRIAGSVKFLNRTNFFYDILLLLIELFNEKLHNTRKVMTTTDCIKRGINQNDLRINHRICLP